MKLPTFLPLADAARKYQIPESLLTQLAQSGKIEAAYFNGEILVSDEVLAETKEGIITQEFAHLAGQPITVTEAMTKYRLPDRTIRGWIARGYIQIVSPGYRKELDEADIAYCARIYHERKANGTRSGAPLLDEQGNPYRLKRPELHAYRRRRKVSKKEAQS